MIPPPDVAPEVLFRRMLAAEHVGSVTFRGYRLTVRPPSRLEEMAVLDGPAWSRPEVEADRVRLELTALATWDGDRRAFESGEVIAASLREEEADALAVAVVGELTEIAPTYLFSDRDAWHTKLRVGAQHQTNVVLAVRLGLCFDHPGIPRPDRYWGKPFNELTEGQWQAFHAARATIKRS